MKKNLFIAALGLVVLAGCSSEDEVSTLIANSDNAINFTTYVGKQTKAAVEGTSLPNDSKFGVFAYNTKAALWNDSKTTAKPDFMYNQEVAFDGTNYTYSPIKYWPNDEKISFIAYYPFPTASNGVSVNSEYKNTTSGLPKIDFTIPTGEVTDLLVSAVVNDKSKENVSFTFQHALSKVIFTAKAVGDGTTVTINSITLTGIKNGGTYDCSDGSWTASLDDLSTSLNAGDSYFMVPQNISNAKVSIAYTVTTKDGNLEKDVTFNGTASDISLATLDITEWAKNTIYNYTLSVSLDKVELSAKVGDWSVPAQNPSI